MLRPEWSQRAVDYLLAILDHIAARNPGAAEALADEILGKTARLPENPRMHRVGRVDGTRELVAHRNYIVIYQETEARILILRVLHAARRWPEDWAGIRATRAAAPAPAAS